MKQINGKIQQLSQVKCKQVEKKPDITSMILSLKPEHSAVNRPQINEAVCPTTQGNDFKFSPYFTLKSIPLCGLNQQVIIHRVNRIGNSS